MARGWRYTKPSLASTPRRVARVPFVVCYRHALVLFYGLPARLEILLNLSAMRLCFPLLFFSILPYLCFYALVEAL